MGVAFIDGENTKGRIREVFLSFDHAVPVWETYDFKGLFDLVFQSSCIEKRKFFRAIPKRHPDILEESEELLLSYRKLGGHLARQGFEVVRAGTLRADYRNLSDKKPRYREKGVDVSLAISMVVGACDDVFDVAYLVASDSDYQPAVAEVCARGKQVVYVGFEINPNRGLMAKASDSIIISNSDVLKYASK